MKRGLLAALLVSVAGSCYAQRPFPDHAANHWAYRAIAEMESEGLVDSATINPILSGHPVTKERMTRAMFACYRSLMAGIDTLQGQLDALKQVDPKDVPRLKLQLSAVQEAITKLKPWEDDIPLLARSLRAFRYEYQTLHLNAAGMKRDLDDLTPRTTNLERVTLKSDIPTA
jgi:hypothetical protein